MQNKYQILFLNFAAIIHLNDKLMAKKKKSNKQQQQQSLSPEQFLKQKARGLEIGKCYVSDDIEQLGEGYVIVTRTHLGGKTTAGVFLLDTFCVGLKDSFYKLRMDEMEYAELIDRIDESMGLSEINYAEAHNRIYGAIAFAEEGGIMPHRSFSLTQYLLEEDTEDIPLIEYEYGKNGKHYLIAHSNLEASRYLPLLRKNLGDDFEYAIGDEEDDFEDSDDFEDLEPEDWKERIGDSPLFKKYGPDMEYTYKHPEYPKQLVMEHPVVEQVLCNPANASGLTREQTDMLLALPHDSLRHDLEQLILYHIGRSCDGISQEMEGEEFNGVVGLAVMLIAEVGNDGSSLDVVLEALRQPENFCDYHYGDMGHDIFVPTLCKLGAGRLDKLMAFAKEAGLYSLAKFYVFPAVTLIARVHPERREEIISWFREILEFAVEKIAETQYIDSPLAGLLVCELIKVRATELLPEIKRLFDTGLVDIGCCGDYASIERDMRKRDAYHHIEDSLDIYERYEALRRMVGKH